MSRDMVLRSPPLDRRQPLLASTSKPSHHNNSSRRFAETAGVTTAGCAAVCCLPVGVVAILFLAVYKVPARLCRRALRMKRRRQRLLRRGLHDLNRCECGFDEVHTMSCGGGQVVCGTRTPMEMDTDVMELEKEMWDRFYGTGFWRSLSQREG